MASDAWAVEAQWGFNGANQFLLLARSESLRCVHVCTSQHTGKFRNSPDTVWRLDAPYIPGLSSIPVERNSSSRWPIQRATCRAPYELLQQHMTQAACQHMQATATATMRVWHQYCCHNPTSPTCQRRVRGLGKTKLPTAKVGMR